MIVKLAKFALLALAALLLSSCTPLQQPNPLSLQIIPDEILAVPAGQPCLLVAAIEGIDIDAGSIVTVSASAVGAEIKPTAWQLSSDGVIELPVTPDPASTGKRIQIVLLAETDGAVRQEICSLHVTEVLPDATTIPLARTAGEILHAFYEWLVGECPDIPAEASGAWTGVPIRPYILGVSHYMFFNDDWEIVIWWHVVAQPAQSSKTSILPDWARIYVRRRHTDLAPWRAAEIQSLHNGDAPHEIEPPSVVIR